MGIREHIKKRIITLDSLIEPGCVFALSLFLCVVETIMIPIKCECAFADGVCHMFGVCNDPIPILLSRNTFFFFSTFNSIFGR